MSEWVGLDLGVSVCSRLCLPVSVCVRPYVCVCVGGWGECVWGGLWVPYKLPQAAGVGADAVTPGGATLGGASATAAGSGRVFHSNRDSEGPSPVIQPRLPEIAVAKLRQTNIAHQAARNMRFLRWMMTRIWGAARNMRWMMTRIWGAETVHRLGAVNVKRMLLTLC